jgi:hypothetical protein
MAEILNWGATLLIAGLVLYALVNLVIFFSSGLYYYDAHGHVISQQDWFMVAALAALIALKYYLRNRNAFQGEKLTGLAEKIRQDIPTDPGRAFKRFSKFLEQDGAVAEFSFEELFALYHGNGRILDAFSLPGLPDSAALGFLRYLGAEARRRTAAGPMLSDAVIDFCLASESRMDEIIRIHDLAGRLEGLVAEAAATRNERRLTVLAATLKRLNKDKEALRLLQAKAALTPDDQAIMTDIMMALGRDADALALIERRPKSQWRATDHVALFRHTVSAGKTDQARQMLNSVMLFKPPKSDPGLYYEFAVLCEKSGDVNQAANIYKHLIAEGVVYNDIVERYGALNRSRISSSGAPVAPGLPPVTAGGERNLVGGNYELRARLGEGGMGVVFEAHDRRLARRVAVKRMRPEIRSSPPDRERFVREARIISKLVHPYILGIHDIIEEGGEIYLVFDYVDGKTLGDILAQGRMPYREVLRILRFVGEAVDYAHRSQVLHRDLKPANIMLDKGGYAKVMDFGLAREAQETLSRLTMTNTAGTPAYMAPEQHLGRPAASSDVYALGVCLYEMATGELPFKGPDLLSQKERAHYIPPSQLAQGWPAGLDTVVAGALSARVDQRIQTAGELAKRLEGLVPAR